MPIPDYQTLMLPLLILAGSNQLGEISLREAIDSLSQQFNLSDEERQQLLPTARQTVIANRVGWARTYLKKAGLLEQTRRGYFKISERGLEVLRHNPPVINVQFLRQFPEFIEFTTGNNEPRMEAPVQDVTETQTPEEVLEIEHQKIRDDLSSQLLQTIKQCSPAFFEQLVIDLLVKMGYGRLATGCGQSCGSKSRRRH